MISPNADLRCTAMQAIADPYWQTTRKDSPLHSQFSCYLNLLPSELNSYFNLSERSSSHTSSLAFEKDLARLMNLSPPWKSKQNIASPLGLNTANEDSKDDLFGSKHPMLAKSKSQSKVAATKSKANITLERILSD
jgi:serine/threonine-protein kinase GIN4